jgi:hypothetical protein
VLLDWWVLDMLIVVALIEVMRRANHTTAVVTLQTAPTARGTCRSAVSSRATT